MTKRKYKPLVISNIKEEKPIVQNESNSTYDTLQCKWILKKKVKK